MTFHIGDFEARGRGVNDRPVECGSVAMATLLVLFAAMIGVVVVSQSVARLRDSTSDADRASATAGAELGVAEALARIEQGATTDFAGTLSTPSVEVAYEATVVDPQSWEIRSEGTADTATQARLATVRWGSGREPAFALFATEQARFHGGNRGTITGALGANADVTLGGTTTTEPVVLFRPDGNCGDCPAVTELDGPWPTPNAVLPTGSTQRCPPEGKFRSTIDGRSGEPILCLTGVETIVFPRTVTIVNPPAIIHVADHVKLDLEHSTINSGGLARDFYLLVQHRGSSNPAEFKADGANITGYVYAPGRWLQLQDYSAVGTTVVARVRQSGTGTIEATFDRSLNGTPGAGDGGWQLGDWQKVAPRP